MSAFATLCLLAYERPGHLRRSIDEIHATAEAPFQLIVHNDGSTDSRVAEVLDRALREGKVSTVISNPPGWNEGVGRAMNRMFGMAQGDLIVKLDSDLVYNPGWLAEARTIMETNQSPDEPAIGLLGLLHYRHDPVDTAKCKLALYPRWEAHTHILGSAFVMHRSAWEIFGPFDEYSESFGEDWEMMMRITDSEGWACGLPYHDLVTNIGMGIGRSTVVNLDGSIHTIHKGPLIIG